MFIVCEGGGNLNLKYVSLFEVRQAVISSKVLNNGELKVMICCNELSPQETVGVEKNLFCGNIHISKIAFTVHLMKK